MSNPNFLPSGYLLLNRYSIQSNIGQGGFGITYLAYDQKLEQEVCVKELFISGNSTRGINQTVQSQSSGDFPFAGFVTRFIQEAKQLAKFQHTNIVRVLDFFEENCTAYMVMEYVGGETLKQKIQRDGVMNEKMAMALITQLLDAVEEVHSKGMLHKDLKPDNVLITPEGRLVLIDFGSAREFVEGKTTSQTAILTPGYAPIEQYSVRAKRGPYTDIYALGATLYFLLTGEKPIPVTDRNLEELIPPHRLNPKVSTQISSAVLLAMELKPENRFQSIEDMREAIKFIRAREERKKVKTEKHQEKENEKTEAPLVKKSGNKISKRLIVIICLTVISVIGYFIYSNYKDSDGDGITDKNDSCPDSYGLEAFNGCPDSDFDGIEDQMDNCPDSYGLEEFNGCPDSDGDGIEDKVDNCPETIGNNPDGCFYYKSITFNNNSSFQAWVAVAYFHEGDWKSIGWYNIKSNNSYTYTLPENFKSNEIYWYANNEYWSEWSGTYQFCVKQPDAFDFSNANDNPSCSKKGFSKLELYGENTEQGLSD